MKRTVFTLGAVLAAVLFTTGCSGFNELSSAISDATNADATVTSGLNITKNKTTKSEIFKSIGAPGHVFNHEDGTSTWVYNRVAVRKTKLGFQTTGTFAALFPYATSTFSKGGGFTGVGATADLKQDKSAYKTAALMINFNDQGCVDTYEFQATSF